MMHGAPCRPCTRLKSNFLNNAPKSGSAAEVFTVFLRLGATSFGGPLAHLGYFHREFVARRQWLTERAYADLVALCQFLPGPASSQVGMTIGLLRRGYLGAIAAWAGFTLPSAVLLTGFAMSVTRYPGLVPTGALHGLKVMAVAVVAQALWNMTRNLCQGTALKVLALVAAVFAWRFPGTPGQVAIIVAAAGMGIIFLKPTLRVPPEPLGLPVSRKAGTAWLVLLGVALTVLWILAAVIQHPAMDVAFAFFRTGSMVFGGGHVVLPVLRAAVVSPGWVPEDVFLAGYGAAQTVPGPLFAFAGYLGAAMSAPVTGWIGAVLCLCAIFAPSFLLVFGTLPHWEQLRNNLRAQTALTAVNAATVGILAAAFQRYVLTSGIQQASDVGIGLLAFSALSVGRVPVWLVGLGCALLGQLIVAMA